MTATKILDRDHFVLATQSGSFVSVSREIAREWIDSSLAMASIAPAYVVITEPYTILGVDAIAPGAVRLEA